MQALAEDKYAGGVSPILKPEFELSIYASVMLKERSIAEE